MQNESIEFTVPAEYANSRLDTFLAAVLPDLSRSFLQKLIRDGGVTADGKTVKLPRFNVRENMVLTMELPGQSSAEIPAEEFLYPILFEDSSMLVINKPAGVVVHPGAGNREGTVVNALLGRYPGMAQSFASCAERPGIVHRLDKDTSGCLAVAKTPEAMFKLGQAFSGHTAKKSYLAICRGVPQHNSGTLNTLIGRHPVNRQKMAIVDRNGKEAITFYEVLARKVVDNIPLALVRVNIATGRTHQIRVHLSSIGLPVAGDELYGRNTAFPGVTRQLLHAYKLSLPHPVSGEVVEFTAPIPGDFKRVMQLMGVI